MPKQTNNGRETMKTFPLSHSEEGSQSDDSLKHTPAWLSVLVLRPQILPVEKQG